MEAPLWKEKGDKSKGAPTHGQKQPAGSKAPSNEGHGSSDEGKKPAGTGENKKSGGSKPPDQTKKPASTENKKSDGGSKQPPDKTKAPSNESGKAKNQGGDDKEPPAKASGGKAAGSVDFKSMPLSELKASYPGRWSAAKSEFYNVAGRMIPTKPSDWKNAAKGGGKNALMMARPVPMAGEIPMDEDG